MLSTTCSPSNFCVLWTTAVRKYTRINWHGISPTKNINGVINTDLFEALEHVTGSTGLISQAVCLFYIERIQGTNPHPAQQDVYRASKKPLMWENSVNGASRNSKPRKLIRLNLNSVNKHRLNVWHDRIKSHLSNYPVNPIRCAYQLDSVFLSPALAWKPFSEFW